MSSERFARVQELFAAACTMPREGRLAFLERQCGADLQLRAEVEQLLAEDSAPVSALDSPIVTADLLLEKTGGEAFPRAIGAYRVLRKLGEGGMGVVLEAEQTKPVVRRVALKIIKAGMDTKQVIARFEAERQALAMMDHPNIAKVLDAGATEASRPYFVMELVRGEPVTDYCDRERLSLEQRLHLFRDVCLAVQHAHQKGIIHRDIKPSNVLVTLADGEPLIKVIDFGIAKATAGRLTEKTLFTELHQLVGTPQYMSPEQAEASGVDIDTRSDIYALGVLLYELLAGTTPLDGGRLRSMSFAEIQRVIREEEPPKPSTRLSAMQSERLSEPPTPSGGPLQERRLQGDIQPGARASGSDSSAAGIADRRRSDPKTLLKQVRGDLDWIAMKCLEKHRTRRYATASALAEDVGRYLDHQPVLATPPSTGYKLRKFARRNRGLVLASAAVTAVLVLGVIGTTLGLVRAVREQRRTERQRIIAQENAAAAETARTAEQRQRRQAEAITEFVTRALVSSDPVQGGSQDFLVTDAMERAIEQLDAGELNDQPETEAALRLTISQILNENARSEHALRIAERALEINRALHAGDHPSIARSLNFVATSLLSLGRSAEALPHFEAALEMRQRLFPDDHADVAGSLTELARCLESRGRSAEALPRQVAALEMLQRLFPGDDAHVANSLNNLAACLQFLGRSAEALPKLEAALEMHRRLYPGDHPKVAMCLNNVASCLESLGQAAEALPHYKRSLDMYRGLFTGDHPSVAQTLNNWARCLESLERRDEALAGFQEALEMTRRLFSGDHPETARSSNNVALCLRSMGRAAEALPNYEAALEMRQRLFPGAHPNVAGSLNSVALCLQSLGRSEEALPKFEASLLMYQQLSQGDNPQIIPILNNAASCLRSLGRSAEALSKFEMALEISRRVLPPGHPNTLYPQIGLAQILVELGRHGDAEPLLRDAAEQCERSEASRRKHWRSVLERSVALYDAWHAAEPDQGHDAKAAEWRAKFAEWQGAQETGN